jgi:uncharacterized protein (TIGR00730 family)
MTPNRFICVYCGSSPGSSARFVIAAEALGRLMAEAQIGLVYGGGNIGLMGALARAVLAHGGHVTGIIPQFLVDREVMLEDVQDLVVTRDMHERKWRMFEKADAFLALPGGIGTLEELVEQMTWVQLGRHKKPILVVNLGGFWDPFLDLLQHMRSSGFVPDSRSIPFLVVDQVEEALPALNAVLDAPEGNGVGAAGGGVTTPLRAPG